MWLLLKKQSACITRFLKNMPWGAWALVSLYLSLLSGVIVGLQYDYQTPYYSTTAIDILIPYGEYFRSLHFYSSQCFFFCCCLHLIAIYGKNGKNTFTEWTKLIITLPVILLLLFTGYILRGDSTGTSAGLIAESIMQQIPFLGSTLNSIFFSLTDSGLRKVYIHHIIGFDLLLLFLAWKHLRTYRVHITEHIPPAGCALLFCAFVSAPIEPDKLGVTYISGPWFFLGLQELLRYLHPLFAGIITPSLFLLALLLSYPQLKKAKPALFFVGCWLLFYALFTIIAWVR